MPPRFAALCLLLVSCFYARFLFFLVCLITRYTHGLVARLGAVYDMSLDFYAGILFSFVYLITRCTHGLVARLGAVHDVSQDFYARVLFSFVLLRDTRMGSWPASRQYMM